MKDYIFGINCNGVSISVTQISIDSDQAVYDYICNVSLKSTWNGNGSYEVSIVNKDNIRGMKVDNWRITKAWIGYDWGSSDAWLIMEDSDGVETCNIMSGQDRGSASTNGFSIPCLTRTIFTKAQQIIRDYPNAKVCNAINKLEESEKNLDIDYLKKRYNESLKQTDEDSIETIQYCFSKIVDYIKEYNQVIDILKELEDERSKQTLKDITSKCKNLLDKFR